jgi:hypothetical protein
MYENRKNRLKPEYNIVKISTKKRQANENIPVMPTNLLLIAIIAP